VAESENPNTAAAAVIWSEAQRQLVAQQTDFEALRNRTVALLSVAAVVAGLFGGRVADHSGNVRLAATWAALALFAATVFFALDLLRPRKHYWAWAHNLGTWLDRMRAGEVTEYDVTFRLSEHFEGYRKANETKLERFHGRFAVVCVLVGLQVIAWGIAVL